MFRFTIRDVLWLMVVVGVNAIVTCLIYITVGWFYIRGYQEVVTDLVFYPIIGLALINALIGIAILLVGLFYSKPGARVTWGRFFICSALIGLSLLIAPPIGKYLNRNLLLHTPLVEAAMYGDSAVVIAKVNRGENPNVRHIALDTTPLHYMALWNKADAVKVLLKHGADPNAQINPSRETPLHYALEHRASIETIRLLLDAGADPLPGDWRGRTPFSLAEVIPDAEGSDIRDLLESKRPDQTP